MGPSCFEGFDRQQPAPGYADKVCSPLYGGQRIRFVDLLAEGEVKVVVCSGPISCRDVLRSGIGPRFSAVLRLCHLDHRRCSFVALPGAPPPSRSPARVRVERGAGSTCCTCVGDSLCELPGIFAGFSATKEASTWASAAQGCVDVVLGAPARECRQSWVVGDDPGTLAAALLGASTGPQPCSQRSIGMTRVSRRCETFCQQGRSNAEG